jgi:hypothetical protein
MPTIPPGMILYEVTIPHRPNESAARREWCQQNVPPVPGRLSWMAPPNTYVRRRGPFGARKPGYDDHHEPSHETWRFAQLEFAVMFEMTWG